VSSNTGRGNVLNRTREIAASVPKTTDPVEHHDPDFQAKPGRVEDLVIVQSSAYQVVDEAAPERSPVRALKT